MTAPSPWPEASPSPRERMLRRGLPVFVNSFNQPSYLRNTVDWLHRHGFGNVLILDQASGSPALAEVYAQCEAEGRAQILRLGENIGPHVALARVREAGFGAFVFTDPDLALPDPPHHDLLCRLLDLSERHRCPKVGLALDISDADRFKPGLSWTHPSLGDFGIVDWERRFWGRAVEPDVYRAEVDTTFFLWNAAIGLPLSRRVRSLLRRRLLRLLTPGLDAVLMPDLRVAGGGFTAKHLPWYVEDGMPEEERLYYARHARRWSSWAGHDKLSAVAAPLPDRVGA